MKVDSAIMSTGLSSYGLSSYAAGRWVGGAGDTEPLLDAATGEEVARIPQRGPDIPRMVDHAKSTGGPALRSLTFVQRAAMIKDLGKALMAAKDDFYPLSACTGATRGDSMVDIDGGIGTLLSYGSMGGRELPDDTVIIDGDIEQLGKEGTFVAQHVYTSRPGVNVQINAFNFPVWGMLEKLAPAFLAGLPSIVKPARQTAYLTEAVFRKMIETGILPEGSIQLVCAGADGLLESLDVQDSVAFTGSAHTGAVLRRHDAVVRGGVRLGVEADSLNCSILGPDVSTSDPEFDLFVKAVVTEMTVKAGQKCTAIRRTMVPEAMVDPVINAIGARLDRVTVGDPRHDGVRMGALASLAQRNEVRKSIETLRAGADIAWGDPEHVDPTGADPDRGAFMSPVLLRAHEGASQPHNVEAFGPVSTVLGYRDTSDAVAMAARGKGSLAGSVVTHRPDFAREIVRELAPWHGRILVLNRDDAEESTGHGSPLPALVHGGPGRAGGGEELGGMRGVKRHMQRTAIQAPPHMLTSISQTNSSSISR